MNLSFIPSRAPKFIYSVEIVPPIQTSRKCSRLFPKRHRFTDFLFSSLFPSLLRYKFCTTPKQKLLLSLVAMAVPKISSITDYTQTQRIVLLIDLNPFLHLKNQNSYLITLISTAKTLLCFPPLSSSLFAFKPFFSSLSPLLSSSKLSIHLLFLSPLQHQRRKFIIFHLPLAVSLLSQFF